MKRVAFLLVTMMLVVGIGVAIGLSSGERGAASQPSRGASTSGYARPSPRPAPVVALPASFAYGEAGTPSPLGDAGQSRLWFQDGSWWGVFLAGATGDQRIFRLDAASNAWSDTGVIVDDRDFARMDVISDDGGVVIASAGPQPYDGHALRIIRFSYDPSARTYRGDANASVVITDQGVEAVTIARTDDGRLWVAYREGGRMAVDHSLDSDLAWRGPFVPVVAEGEIERVAIAALGDRVAVVWTTPHDDVVSMAWHDTGGPEDTWAASPGARLAGLRLGEDELSVATDRSAGSERLFVAVKTSAELAPQRSQLDPQVVLVEFEIGQAPTSYLFGRVDDQHSGPIILIDRDARDLYVVAAAPKAGGALYYKRTSLDDIKFPTGPGTLFVPAAEDHPRLANPTSTKQAVATGDGIVVAATDTRMGTYGFGSLGLSVQTAGTPAPSGLAAPAPLGIIATPSELAALPMSGPAWDRLKAAADGSLGTPDISVQNGTHDVLTLAVALVYGRTGIETYRAKAADAIMSAIGTEEGGLASNLGRNLISYVMAADLIDFASFDPEREAQFRIWLSASRFEVFSDGSIASEDRNRANNHGRLAGASRLAASLYLRDDADLLEAIAIFKGWLGDESSYDGFAWKSDASWQADPTNPVGVNPVGSTKDGFSIDGALPEEMRRGCEFTTPPCATNYPWESLSAVLLVAEILDRQGYDAWAWEDQALLRAADFLHEIDLAYGGWWAEGDDTWQPWLINHAYGTNYPTEPAVTMGKTFAWSDWLWAPVIEGS